MDNWADLIDHAGDWEASSRVKPNWQLYVYTDGSLRQLDSTVAARCYVHKWLSTGKDGRLFRVQRNHIQERISNSCKTVHCQRLLVQGQTSQFIEVLQPGEDSPNVVPDGDAA